MRRLGAAVLAMGLCVALLTGCDARRPVAGIPIALAGVVFATCRGGADPSALVVGAVATPDGLIRLRFTEIDPTGTDGSGAAATGLMDQCADVYPLDDRSTRLARLEDRMEQYDYITAVLMPCLERLGVRSARGASPPPSRMDFARGAFATWSPYPADDIVDADAARQVAQECPSLPPSLRAAPLLPRQF